MFGSLLSIDPFTWPEIGSAILCGFIIGFERQLRGKPVGIRTSSLIILGTYVFVTASFYVATDDTDPSRIIGQVVTGIGFLGAGVMLSRDGMVMGVTSAATIWGLAAIGVCIAAVSIAPAIKLSVIFVLILVGVDLLEESFVSLTRGVHKRIRGGRNQG
ncbi:MAG: MgtC/SapB family protein [Pseudohongiellaceae bacterium]